MNNVMKLLSQKKDSRIVIVNTEEIFPIELVNKDSERFLKEMLTCCMLFAALNDFKTKTSFTLRINRELKVYCLIQEGCDTRIEFSHGFERKDIKPKEQFTHKSSLSATVGDFSGMHTSTILADSPQFSEILNFYSKQSEQLPTKFLMSSTNPFLGAVVQPLPFANIDSINDLSHTIAEKINLASDCSWEKIPVFFKNIGTILWGKKVI